MRAQLGPPATDWVSGLGLQLLRPPRLFWIGNEFHLLTETGWTFWNLLSLILPASLLFGRVTEPADLCKQTTQPPCPPSCLQHPQFACPDPSNKAQSKCAYWRWYLTSPKWASASQPSFPDVLLGVDVLPVQLCPSGGGGPVCASQQLTTTCHPAGSSALLITWWGQKPQWSFLWLKESADRMFYCFTCAQSFCHYQRFKQFFFQK